MQKFSGVIFILAIVGSLVGYYFFNYHLDRSDFWLLIGLVLALFVLYGIIYSFRQVLQRKIWWFILAVLLRGVSLFSLPNLSDDYYRFVWDGELLTQGHNPYSVKPAAYEFSNEEMRAQLLDSMNSPNYYSVYPPVLQVFFELSAIEKGVHVERSVVVLKLLMLIMETVGLIYLYLLIKRYGKAKGIWILYALNPLVIIEFSGNLHFEGVMITFLLLLLYYLPKDPWNAGLFLGLGVFTKLTPLMLLPLLIFRLKLKDSIEVGLSALSVVLALGVIYFNLDNLSHFMESISLYFQVFEFNASISYLFREIGYLLVDYNIVKLSGSLLSLISMIGILLIAYQRRKSEDVFLTLFLIFLIQLVFSGLVHPWYITPVVLFGILSGKVIWTGVVWSGMVFLSYATYQTSEYHENLFLVALEYTAVFGVLAWEAYQWWTNKVAIR